MSHIALSAKQLATIAVAASSTAPTPRTIQACQTLETASRHNLGMITAADILNEIYDEANDFHRSTETLVKALTLINSLAYNMKDRPETLRALLRMSTTIGIIAAVIAIAVAVFKSDDCWPDPEPEPVPCKGSHCPVEGEATTGEVIKDALRRDRSPRLRSRSGLGSPVTGAYL